MEFIFPLLQAMYNEFSAVNIQVDKDFSAKLSGYGCVGLLPEADLSNSSSVSNPSNSLGLVGIKE